MGFASLLSEISSDPKLKARLPSQQPGQQPKPVAAAKVAKPGAKRVLSATAKPVIRKVDDDDDAAVRRLKEARRKEREERDARLGVKKPAKRPSASPKASTQGARASSKASVSRSRTATPVVTPPPPKPVSTGPKLSFQELMKQAEGIDRSKLAFNAIKKPASASAKPKPSQSLQMIRRAEKMQMQELQQRKVQKSNKTNPHSNEPKSKATFAKPSLELQQRIERRKQMAAQNQRVRQRPNFKPRRPKDSYGIDAEDDDEDDDGYGYGYDGYDDEDDEDDFIVNDNDDQYTKGQIWNMFNKNKRYDDYDDVDDDMEATGEEIFDEEERALKQAKLDDKREQMLLEKRAAEKRKRLGR